MSLVYFLNYFFFIHYITFNLKAFHLKSPEVIISSTLGYLEHFTFSYLNMILSFAEEVFFYYTCFVFEKINTYLKHQWFFFTYVQ